MDQSKIFYIANIAEDDPTKHIAYAVVTISSCDMLVCTFPTCKEAPEFLFTEKKLMQLLLFRLLVTTSNAMLNEHFIKSLNSMAPWKNLSKKICLT